MYSFFIGMLAPMAGGTLLIYRYVGIEKRISFFLFAGLFGFTGAELVVLDALTSDVNTVDWIKVFALSGKVGIGMFLISLVGTLILAPMYSAMNRTRMRK